MNEQKKVSETVVGPLQESAPDAARGALPGREPLENPVDAWLYRKARGAARRAALLVGGPAVIAFAAALPVIPARVALLDVPLGAMVVWSMLALLFRAENRAGPADGNPAGPADGNPANGAGRELQDRAEAWWRAVPRLLGVLLVGVLAAAFLVTSYPAWTDAAAAFVVAALVFVVLAVLLYPVLPRLPEDYWAPVEYVEEDHVGIDWNHSSLHSDVPGNIYYTYRD